ncbi:hypothetical protein HPB48_021194 [Haemaphysalis longicornis]|uniref:E3 ubiquitin-protein ligase Topors n=1 Tax=Haemaphysalis longicornis TaxID=44386 RepID=A0A9J6FUB0_HAELO|nr:hypothetical protein HPB48_021194 [Haemaphysalis longicornis]
MDCLHLNAPSLKMAAAASSSPPRNRNTASPEDSCAICLGAPENKSFTDSCFHTFCFACLAEWAKVKAECPLCKQRFESIIHSVRSLEDYDQYFVSELQRPSLSTMEYYNGRYSGMSAMTAGWLEELEMRQHVRHATVRNRHQERHVPRGAVTSAERQELYGLDLWAVPSYSHYRETSPRFYRDNPACTHRLVPWLNRELNALMTSQSSVRQVMDIVMWLILDYDIRHPAFAATLHCFLDQYAEHFVYEFYLFATSVHDMVEYDRNTVYKSRSQAYWRGDPVKRFREALAKQNRTAPRPATARRESPQPGPSGLGAARQGVTTSVVSDSDSDSSDCILVKVVKPQRERTPVVIEILTSSDDERDLTAPGPSQDRRTERAGSPSEISSHRCCSPEFDNVTSSSADSCLHPDLSPVSCSSPELRDVSPASFSEFSEISNSLSDRSRSGEHSREVHSVQKQEHVADEWETSSDDDSRPPAQAKTPRKLESVVVAVNAGRKRSRDASSREHHCSRRHRRCCDHNTRTSTPNNERRHRSSSREF